MALPVRPAAIGYTLTSTCSSSRAAAEQGFVVVVGGGFDDGGEPLDPPHADTSSPSAADARRRFTARYFLI